ncbi:M28 family metallopeptidase [Fischerella sp. PCC 9605]|uniref:M28 family metallopeptidase n=1 Tax=Fischerella sp. PCC 9605 TaxID=1173024 RepID=UPI0018CC24E2|nr:M28 family metallopeptidase [Fischerella sp. PCC 9605]
MQVFTCRTSTNLCESQLDLSKLSHTFWVQFGQEALLITDESDWHEILKNGERRGTPLQIRPKPSEKKNLHLVVQKGRLFQQEHPNIPVLMDKGRFLVVDLDPELVDSFNKGDEPCYAVRPLEENMVVFKERPKTAARSIPAVWIQDLVEQVSRSSLEANLIQLVSWSTRYSTNAFYFEAATWAREQLEKMDYNTQLESIVVRNSTSQNVIADKPGYYSQTRDLVLVVAHLDSINNQDGPLASAPGADDNGSGSAGLLEIARVLNTYQNKHDLRFILFGGEEQGLFGSKQYIDSLNAAERTRIKAVLNMDMIGTINTDAPTVLLEGAPVSQSVIDNLAEAAETYTGLTVQTSLNPFASDHVPFIDVGIPAVLTIEGADSANSNIHTANDTLTHISYDLMLEILRMNIAFIASAVNQ